MKAIVYRRLDGGTAIVHPASRHRISELAQVPWLAWLAGQGIASATEEVLDEKWIEYVRDKDVPADATEVRIIDAADIPVDRTFRGALCCDLSHDMGQAKAIWRDQVRGARAAKLRALDLAWMRAAEAGDAAAQAAIVVQKQALRDAPADPAIEAAATCDALKAVWPKALPERPVRGV